MPGESSLALEQSRFLALLPDCYCDRFMLDMSGRISIANIGRVSVPYDIISFCIQGQDLEKKVHYLIQLVLSHVFLGPHVWL